MKGDPYGPIKSMRFWRANVGDAGTAAVVRANPHRTTCVCMTSAGLSVPTDNPRLILPAADVKRGLCWDLLVYRLKC